MTHYAGKGGAGGRRPKKRAQGRQAKAGSDGVFFFFFFSPASSGGLVNTGQSGSGWLCFLGQACQGEACFLFMFRFSCFYLVLYYLFLFQEVFAGSLCKSKEREAVLKKKAREGKGGETSVCWALDVTNTRISPSFSWSARCIYVV